MWMELQNVDDIADRLPRLKTITLQHSRVADLSGLASLPWLERVHVLSEDAQALREALQGKDVEIVIDE